MANSATHPSVPALRYRVAGMDCGDCALTIEKAVRKLPQVETARVDFTTEILEVTGGISRERIEHIVHELGYRLEHTDRIDPGTPGVEARGLAGFLKFVWKHAHTRIASVGGVGLLLLMLWQWLAPLRLPDALASTLLVGVVVVVGLPIFLKGLRSLIFARRATIDLLMAIASIGAVAIGETGEAAVVVLLFTLGEALEAYSAERSRDALRALMRLQPDEATVLRDHCCDGHGHEDHFSSQTVSVRQIRPGDWVLVRPGQRIPVDGVIREGSSSVNQASVTGESIPVPKSMGDAVLAGTINGEGALKIEANCTADDSTVARIARLVENALAQRSPAERFVDRFARWYTPAVVLTAALVATVPVLFFGEPLLSEGGTQGWLYRALALLIVACPCALIISIPVTVVSALTRLAGLGVLVKGGDRLDRLADVQVVAFDKTGTLTQGRPAVSSIRSAHCDHPEPQIECGCCDDVLALAASVENSSEHPVAHAIVSFAHHRGVQHRYSRATAVRAHAGRGVTGEVNGDRITVGSDIMFLADEYVLPDRVRDQQSAAGSSETLTLVARGREVIGSIGVKDQVRPESRAALESMRSTSPSIRTVMLTGDKESVAQAVARDLGILDGVRAGLLPEGKLAAIADLQREHGVVAMIGDGINDAPALAKADVGIAMGTTGTAQAIETADVVLVTDDLKRIASALRISRRARAVIKQNIALSLGLKLLFLGLAIPGLATLWLAVVADVGATLIVTLNGMRLLRSE